MNIYLLSMSISPYYFPRVVFYGVFITGIFISIHLEKHIYCYFWLHNIHIELMLTEWVKEWMDKFSFILSLLLFGYNVLILKDPYLINIHEVSPSAQWVKLDSTRLGEWAAGGLKEANIPVDSIWVHLSEGCQGMVVITAEGMMVYIWNWEPAQHPESGEEVLKRPGNDMTREPVIWRSCRKIPEVSCSDGLSRGERPFKEMIMEHSAQPTWS